MGDSLTRDLSVERYVHTRVWDVRCEVGVPAPSSVTSCEGHVIWISSLLSLGYLDSPHTSFVTADFSGREWFLANLGCRCQTCFALFARVLWGSSSHWSCCHPLCLFGVLWLAPLLQATSCPAEKGTVFPAPRQLAGATNRGISHLASLENFKELWYFYFRWKETGHIGTRFSLINTTRPIYFGGRDCSQL